MIVKLKKILSVVMIAGEIVFVSCKSSENKIYFSNVDYTELDAVNDEIRLIRSKIESERIRSLWKAKLMSDNLPGNEEASRLFEDCISSVSGHLKKLYDEKKYLDSLRYSSSLEAIGVPAEKISVSSLKLEKLVSGNMISLSEKSSKAKVSDMIKGTVTVFVDKGIKIQKGIGYADAVLGSGFFITKDGYIVTNHHVIEDMVNKEYEGYSRLYIKLAEDPDTRIPAKVVGYDSTLDLALLKTSIEAPYVFSLGSSNDLSVGDRVSAIGSPLGLEKTLTSGIISSVDRQLLTVASVFQIDAAVNSGNSGGPLIDEQGKVQAVVFAGVQYRQGLNFAIPVEYLKNILPYLLDGGEFVHPWMEGYGKTKRLPGSGAKNEGVAIMYVLPGGNLSRAGIQEGDVIKAINGNKIYSLDDIHSFCMLNRSDSIVKVSVMGKDEKLKDHFVYLSDRPYSPGYEFYMHDLFESAAYPILGFRLTPASENRKKFFVSTVMKGSVADSTGFSENDYVELMDINFSEKKESIYVRLYAKKRKNGFLDGGLAMPAPLDGPFYF